MVSIFPDHTLKDRLLLLTSNLDMRQQKAKHGKIFEVICVIKHPRIKLLASMTTRFKVAEGEHDTMFAAAEN